MTRRDQQIHMVAGTLAPHKILGATDHLSRKKKVTAKGEAAHRVESSSHENEKSGFMTNTTAILPEPITFCFPFLSPNEVASSSGTS